MRPLPPVAKPFGKCCSPASLAGFFVSAHVPQAPKDALQTRGEGKFGWCRRKALATATAYAQPSTGTKSKRASGQRDNITPGNPRRETAPGHKQSLRSDCPSGWLTLVAASGDSSVLGASLVLGDDNKIPCPRPILDPYRTQNQHFLSTVRWRILAICHGPVLVDGISAGLSSGAAAGRSDVQWCPVTGKSPRSTTA